MKIGEVILLEEAVETPRTVIRAAKYYRSFPSRRIEGSLKCNYSGVPRFAGACADAEVGAPVGW
jgi:hypothetical protein